MELLNSENNIQIQCKIKTHISNSDGIQDDSRNLAKLSLILILILQLIINSLKFL